MNPIIERLTSAFEKAVLSKVKPANLFAEYYNRSDKKVPWVRQSTNYSAKEINDWKLAVMSATDPDDPRRGLLMRFYQAMRLDNHLASIVDTRILRVQRSSYKIVNEKGEENEDLKKLLERPWFEDLVRLVIGKTFQGTTLIEMFDTDDLGELFRVNEIPQTNFIAKKGLILKEEYDQNGVSYVDGTYKDYYLQVGDDYDLGMYNDLAMIVLGKKLCLGSMMQYIEKYGIPPIFAITDRYDPTRQQELFQMLESFRMNHFAILQGQEKIEIPKSDTQGCDIYAKLINDVYNTEMSKRVLGGTALTDVKAFAGSSMVQERVAQDRYEADKLVFKYYFNTQVRQRLAKISSVYKDFLTHTFVWDNQEMLEIKDYIDGVQKLSEFYEFDFEEIKARTGLPIIGLKAAVTAPAVPPAGDNGQKKKPNASVGFEFFDQVRPPIYASTWDMTTEKLAKGLYNKQIQPKDLDKDLVLKNYASLSKEAEAAWGEGYYDSPTTRNMRQNLIRFAGAKAYSMMSDIDAIDSKAGMSEESFLENAKKIVTIHNETWLETERMFVAASASNARDWERFNQDTDLYPNLRYRTMEDEDVRDSHVLLDGIIKPIDDPFWSTYFPPNGWRCRCFTEQTTEPASDTKVHVTIPEEFKNNAGTNGTIFLNNNSYQESVKKKDIIPVNDNTEGMKQFAPYNRIEKTKDGNKLHVNDFADPSDLEENITAGAKIADLLKKDVYIRPHSNTSTGVKNPEYGIGMPGNLADLKTFNKKSTGVTKFIKNAFKSAISQKCDTVVLNLSDADQDDHAANTANKIRGEVKSKPSFQSVIIIRGDDCSQYSRKKILDPEGFSL